MISGSRKSIRPGEVIWGPESLTAIPGLDVVTQDKKTIIVSNPTNSQTDEDLPTKKTITPDKIVPPEFISKNIDSSITTNLSQQIESELIHLRMMKGLQKNPSVTIIILTKNRLDLISNCCESLFNKVFYPNITIMIADTGSTELPVLRYYDTLASKCAIKGWKYQFVNLGYYYYSKNYNQAIRHVTTEYVLIQNNDTVALNDYVTEMMYTGSFNKVGSVGCRMLYPDKQTIQHDGQTIYNSPGGMVGSPNHLNIRKHINSIPENESYTSLVDGNTAAGVLMKVTDYQRIGGFEEQYKDIFQDVDLMMKIPNITKKFNYCNRIANIIHIDNASRFSKGADPKIQQAMWGDTRLISSRITSNHWERVVKPKDVEFSIITLVHNMENYEQFCETLKTQAGQHTVEIIAIPNFYNQFTSTFKAYNSAADIANGSFLIFTHDDILVTTDWLLRIKKQILELEDKRIPWGVLGPAGVFMDSDRPAYYLLDAKGKPLKETDSSVLTDLPRYEVVSLDEMCLITKKSNRLRFSDKDLSGFHFYGTNICVNSHQKGLKTFAIDAYCHHKSDGYKNISSVEGYADYEKSFHAFNSWCKKIGVNDWRSTTARVKDDKPMIYVKKPSK